MNNSTRSTQICGAKLYHVRRGRFVPDNEGAVSAQNLSLFLFVSIHQRLLTPLLTFEWLWKTLSQNKGVIEPTRLRCLDCVGVRNLARARGVRDVTPGRQMYLENTGIVAFPIPFS